MSLTLRVAISLVVGLLLGFAVSSSHWQWLGRIPAILDPIGTVFVNAIRVAVIPLVVSSLIVGIAAGDSEAGSIGRLGGRALALILAMLLAAALFALAGTLPLIARLNIDTSIVQRMKEGAVVDATAQASLHIPAAGIGILLAVDTIPDIFRTTANVTGWLCAGSILHWGAAVTPKLGAPATVGADSK